MQGCKPTVASKKKPKHPVRSLAFSLSFFSAPSMQKEAVIFWSRQNAEHMALVRLFVTAATHSVYPSSPTVDEPLPEEVENVLEDATRLQRGWEAVHDTQDARGIPVLLQLTPLLYQHASKVLDGLTLELPSHRPDPVVTLAAALVAHMAQEWMEFQQEIAINHVVPEAELQKNFLAWHQRDVAVADTLVPGVLPHLGEMNAAGLFPKSLVDAFRESLYDSVDARKLDAMSFEQLIHAALVAHEQRENDYAGHGADYSD